MKECCIRGVRHEGTPKGEIVEVNGHKAYVTKPPSPSEIGIVYFADAFGHDVPNAKLLADDFAAAGYTIIVPDIFRGDAVPESEMSPTGPSGGKFDIYAWLAKHPTEKVEPVMDAAIQGLKEQFGCKKIGAVGYCFGGRYVVRYLSKGVIDAGFAAHASLVGEDELEAITKPLSFACAEVDEIMPNELRHKFEDILAKKTVPYEVCIYGGVEHGFAVRADLKDPRKMYAKEAAYRQATLWFDQWIKD